MKDRLKEIRKTKRLNQKEFANELGIAQNTYSLIETGKIAMSERNIKMICLTFNVSEHWLRTGEGAMFVDDDPALADILETFRKLSPFSQDVIITLAHTLLEKEIPANEQPGPA